MHVGYSYSGQSIHLPVHSLSHQVMALPSEIIVSHCNNDLLLLRGTEYRVDIFEAL